MYYSQFGQDRYLAENIFKDLSFKGYYVEIGAHNGIEGSNSKYFEDIGWGGTCVEPIPELFTDLVRNRRGRLVNGCISSSEEKVLKFRRVKGYAEMLSGLSKFQNNSHVHRINSEVASNGGEVEVIEVNNYRFEDIIKRKKIDYLSVDVEGAELDIFQSIDFNKYDIKAVTFENNYNEDGVREILRSNGYLFVEKFTCDELWTKV